LQLDLHVCNKHSQLRCNVRLIMNENIYETEIATFRRLSNNISPAEIDNKFRLCINCNKSINAEIEEMERELV